MVETAFQEVGPEKIVFGADIPLLNPFVQIAKVKSAKTSEEEKSLILGKNIARIAHLDVGV
jgi:predicted TIM-barrel fold metal-dependent hydrolase